MTVLSQKDAVYKAVTASKRPDGTFDRKVVVTTLMEMFRNGEFIHGDPSKVRDEGDLRDYCGSVLSNWLRKDPRLGGADISEPRERRKKSRPVDDEMKRLVRAKSLLMANNQDTAEIETLIQQRDTSLRSERDRAKQEAVEDAEALLAAIEQP